MQGIAEVIACAESTVCNYIHEILPYLRQELPASLLEQWQQDCTSVERAELEHWLAELPEGALLVHPGGNSPTISQTFKALPW
jgi:hypothetical protein